MLRVLHVDDDHVNSLLFVELCRLVRDVEVKTARTAAQALELVRRCFDGCWSKPVDLNAVPAVLARPGGAAA